MYRTCSHGSPCVKMVSPRRKFTILVAIPADSRNACALKLTFFFDFIMKVVERSQPISLPAGERSLSTGLTGFAHQKQDRSANTIIPSPPLGPQTIDADSPRRQARPPRVLVGTTPAPLWRSCSIGYTVRVVIP